MASIVSILVWLKLSISVRLGNIVYPSPLEAVSILVHMAFVYPKMHLSFSGQFVDNFWRFSGDFLDYFWTISGQFLDNFWTILGYDHVQWSFY
jgi:hypothetical protein